MRKYITLSLLLICICGASAEEYNIMLYRKLSYDIFGLNASPYLKPMVESVNATANSRFFNTAYIPRSVNKPYFKVSLNGMLGLVADSKKNYNTTLPSVDPADISKYVTLDPIKKTAVIKDTAGLMYYALLSVINDGVKQKKLYYPQTSPTVLGKQGDHFGLPHEALKELVKSNAAWPYLPTGFQDQVLSTIDKLPWYVTMPSGGDINTLKAGVPQIEIGSLYGTELLIRCIPPLDLGTYVGKFSFWGLGLKHSLSQYIPDCPFDFAVQAVGQGSHLTNTVGETNAKLVANAVIWDVNLHASKSIRNWFDAYAGVSYEKTYITSSYNFLMPIEIQKQLNYEDHDPQCININAEDDNVKFVIGVKKDIGSLALCADYNIGKFNIFSFGIQYGF